MYSKRYQRLKQSGFTLLELMIVIALLSIILGMSSAFFTHFNRKLLLRTVVSEISVLIRAARSAAIKENAPVRVKISKDSWLESWGTKVSGYWHFEDTITTGAFGRNGQAQGVEITSGKIGKALQFHYGKSKVDCGSLKYFNVHEGCSLSAWVYLQRWPGNNPLQICRVGSWYTLEVGTNQLLYLQGNGKKTQIPYHMPLYRWVHLELLMDHNSCLVMVDHIARGTARAKNEKRIHDNLIIGSAFQGKLDAIKLARFTIIDTFILPKGVQIETSPATIKFDRHGNLHPFYHVSSEAIVCKRISRKQKIRGHITVFVNGDVEFVVP